MNAPTKKVTIIPAKNPKFLPEQRNRKKLRVAAYCRVSSDKDEQINSFEVQVQHYTEMISSNPNWKNAGIFADEGISGTSIKNRKEFQRLLRHCQEGRIDLILVKSVSRFGRNTEDALKISRRLKKINVGVVFEKENLDTRTMQSEMMLTFFSAFSQSESESMSANIKWGYEKSFAQGKVRISPTMYGFTRSAEGEIVIDEPQAKVVRMIYQDYLDGMSLGRIKEKLEKMKVKTAFGRDTWNAAVISSLLSNEKYMGDALLQKTYTPSIFDHRSKKNNGELAKYYVSDCLPVIVDPNVFQQVQLEMARRRAKRATSEKVKNQLAGKYSSKYALSDILVCGKCGSHYRRTTWAKKGKKKIVWRCGNRLDYGTQFCNKSPTLEESALQAAIVRGMMNQYIDKDGDITLLKANLDRALAPQMPGGEADIRSRIAELEQQRQELILRCLDENDVDTYTLLLTNIKTELDTLHERLESIESQKKDRTITESRMAEINELLARFMESDMQYDDVLVRRLISAIHVESAEEIKITFRDGKSRTENIEQREVEQIGNNHNPYQHI